MKRFFVFFLALVFLNLCSCQSDRRATAILENLSFPLEFDCAFSFEELDGLAHVRITDEALSLGITDGALGGLVVSVSDESTRFLYDGTDLNFSSDTTQKLQTLKRAFSFLQTQNFSQKHAVEREGGLFFAFPFEEGTLTFCACPDTLAMRSLTLSGGLADWKLDIT